MWAKLVGGLVTGRAVAVLITVIVGLASWAGWASWEVRRCNQSLGGMTATAGQNERAVVALSERLTQEALSRALDLESERAASAVLEQRLQRIQAQANAERRERDEIYSTDGDCEAWRSTRVCGPIADRLCARARTLDPDVDRGSVSCGPENP